MIDVLFLPIFRTSDLENIRNNIDITQWSFSGAFVLTEDDTLGNTLLLKRRNGYSGW